MVVLASALLALAGWNGVQAAPSSSKSGLDVLAKARQGRYFGTATEAANINNSTAFGQAYKKIVLGSDFGIYTPENSLKWEVTEPQRGVFNFTLADALFRVAESNGKKMRGHTLAWHSQLPPWVAAGNFSKSELKNILRDHIFTEVGRYRGRVFSWDVANEIFNEDGTFRESVWYTTLGADYVQWAFEWAHEADPNAILTLNDYNFESITPKTQAAYVLVKKLKKKGVPIHAIGAQAHLISGQVPTDFNKTLALFASLGVDVAITELDIRINLPVTPAKLAQQAEDYKSAVNACLSVSRCIGITVWQHTDALSWVPAVFAGQGAADIYDEKNEPKPAYFAVQQALAKK